MKRTEKRIKIFSIVMQLFLQMFLLLPWMNLGTERSNVPWYVMRWITSGNVMSYITDSLKSLGILDGLDQQMLVQVMLLFIVELVLVLFIQLIGIVNIILTMLNRHKMILDIVALVAGCAISFLGADSAAFTDPLSQVYPFALVILLVINVIGVKMIDSWQENKKMQEEIKEKEKNYKEEKERRLKFPGKYPEGFYKVMWKNFKRSKKDFMIYLGMNLLPASMLYVGVGIAQMLAPFNKEGNILTGHGITAILLEFLTVILVATLILMLSNLLSYFRKRMRNYSLFSSLGMRKMTVYIALGMEILAGVIGMLIGGMGIGSVTLIIIRKIFTTISGISIQPAKITGFTFLVASLILIGISVISLMIMRDHFLYRELTRLQTGNVQKEKMPKKYLPLGLAAGIVLTLISLARFGMRKNAEGLSCMAGLFLGIYLVEKFGFALLLNIRKNRKKAYYRKLMLYNSFYYRFKSTFRYVYVVSVIPILILFVFGKNMISARIAEEPETLFPYDFVCMGTEEDDTFWNQLKEKYDIKFQEYPMVRVTNVDNSEKMDNSMTVIMPQGQHIGISETTYKQLNKALGKKSENLNLSKDGKEIYIVYQQDKSVKAHPLDYLNTRKSPYLHIGQPLDRYFYLYRDTIYPKRKVKEEKMDILTGAFRQGSEENLVVFSDQYFDKIRDDWKKYDWTNGERVKKEDVKEGVTIHHWPTRLVLLKVKDTEYEQVERELQTFRKIHEIDEKFDQDVLSCYSKRTSINQIKSERFMTAVIDIFIVGAFLIGSILVIYLKYESEMEEKKRRNQLLMSIGMRTEDRHKIIRLETEVFFWIPVIVALIFVPILTWQMWNMRQYTAADCGQYRKELIILAVIYGAVQYIGVKLIERYTIRKVEKTHGRNIKSK